MPTFSIRAGSSRSNEGGSIHIVNRVFEHPNFDPFTLDYDASILQLSNLIKIDQYRQPIRMSYFGEQTYERTSVILKFLH